MVLAARRLLGQGARALVVALRGSAGEPDSEREVERILDAEYPPHRLGCVPITLSHQVSRRPEDALRTNAALLNARVHGLLARSLREAEDALRERSCARPLLIVHADGGCGRVAKTRALDTYASGPAAVAHGAARICAGRAGSAIAMDIGGTTTNLAFVTGAEPRLLPRGSIGGHPVGQPLPEVWSLALGGGSIARRQDGKLTVGPESAGALPGPACFDLGGADATVTDACLALGFFAPDRFFGGRRQLRADLGQRALERLSAGGEALRTAAAIKDTLEEQVAAAIRAHGQGIDLTRARLLALGGGGALHAAAIAAKLGLHGVDIFPFSPAFGAFGASTLDVVHVYQAALAGQTANGRLVLGQWYADLVAAARRDLRGRGDFRRPRLRVAGRAWSGPARRFARALPARGRRRAGARHAGGWPAAGDGVVARAACAGAPGWPAGAGRPATGWPADARGAQSDVGDRRAPAGHGRLLRG